MCIDKTGELWKDRSKENSSQSIDLFDFFSSDERINERRNIGCEKKYMHFIWKPNEEGNVFKYIGCLIGTWSNSK